MKARITVNNGDVCGLDYRIHRSSRDPKKITVYNLSNLPVEVYTKVGNKWRQYTEPSTVVPFEEIIDRFEGLEVASMEELI